MPTRYLPRDNAFESTNLPFVCNRAIFCANTATTLLTGDRPVLRLIRYGTLLGTLRLWLDTENGPVYLDEFSSIRFRYRANLAEWELRDDRCPATVTLAAGAPEETEGFTLCAKSDAPVKLCWHFGGIYTFEECHWNLTNDEPEAIGLADSAAEWYLGNDVSETDGVFTLVAATGSEGSGLALPGSDPRISTGHSTVYLRCTQTACIDEDRPGVCGTLCLANGADAFISVSRSIPAAPEAAWESVMRRHETLSHIFTSHTPDAYLDTQMAAISCEIDGAWYSPYTVHSNQAWNAPYLGWCNRFGNAIGGWIDRVITEVEYYCGFIHKTDDLRSTESEPEVRFTEPGKNSRFYGIGHVDKHQYMYNMQTQFFDQAIFAWRMTNDPKLTALLRDALEYHTLWQDECFDSDNDGLYESVINTWPTDSVWYNGGGSCEETCYAYRAHQAALELAEAAGDTTAVNRHRQRLALILKGFKEKLWLKDAGYPAMYVEDGGHGRAHRSAWLYNSFMPVDMDMVDMFDAATCLDFPRWMLENVEEPTGGKMLWLSNWVPAIWSVREKSAGENFQQAYACFKAGFAKEGYDLLTGSLRLGGFGRPYCEAIAKSHKPSGISSEAASLLARAVVNGLHGFRPDYPNGRVIIAPQYPTEWEAAAIATSHFNCNYTKNPGSRTVTYTFTLAQPAETVELRFPLCGAAVSTVTGADTSSVQPGIGCRYLTITLHNTACGEVSFTFTGEAIEAEPLDIACAPGDTLTPAFTDVTEVYDPQGVLAGYTLENGRAVLRLRTDMEGAHMVFLCRGCGEDTLWQSLRLDISITEEHRAYLARTKPEVTGCHCEPLPLPQLTDDVRTIFQQDYYTPRDHLHLSLGADGYSPWTFAHWGIPTPEIGFDKAGATVTDRENIPFRLGSENNNIAFTSLYPNWPTAVTVPVEKEARAVKLLVCGSTNPMQIDIANAAIRFRYTDGSEEQLELVNPDNFWSLCPYDGRPSEKDQGTTNDYSYEASAFCLPETPPDLIELGSKCRAVSLAWQLAAGKTLSAITLETLSQEVVIGLMAVTLVDPKN